ncbi:MAG: hypothetical protein IT386_13460, partial [Deltaproteobacteria bacterium]|nr:hypothetical protein [Deltaproteobacteria bacterium]
RHYDPATGSFLEPDPLGIDTDQLYAYAASNPYVYGDPTGLRPASLLSSGSGGGSSFSSLGGVSAGGGGYSAGTSRVGSAWSSGSHVKSPGGVAQFNPAKLMTGGANAVIGVKNIATGVAAIGSGSTAILSIPATGPVGILSGSAAVTYGVVKIGSGIGGLRRGLLQVDEALNERFEAASSRNLLGILPSGQKFDDPIEPTPLEYVSGLYQHAVKDPFGAASRVIHDFLVIDDSESRR